MAIFGGQDVELPIITQLVQVDTGDADEMRRFWVRCSALASALLPYDAAGIVPGEDGHTVNNITSEDQKRAQDLLEVFERGDAEELIASQWDRFATDYWQKFLKVTEDARLIISRFRESGELRMDLLLALREEYGVKAGLVIYPTYPQRDEVPFSEVAISTYLFYRIPQYYIVAELDGVLMDIWRRKGKFLTECWECENTYVGQRRNARYCSHRCAARVRQRTLRAAESEDVKRNVALS